MRLPITSVAGADDQQILWQIVEEYMTRWRVEDAIRFIEQSYRIEDIRLLDYTRLKT